MTNNGRVSNKDLYKAIDNFRKEVQATMEKAEARCLKRHGEVKENVEENTSWRNRITGQFAIITIAVGIVINWFFSQFTK